MNNSRNLLGRITALVLILGVAYGVHRLACGGGACPVMRSCCMPGAQKTEGVPADLKTAPEKAAPAKAEPAPAPKNGGDEE